MMDLVDYDQHRLPLPPVGFASVDTSMDLLLASAQDLRKVSLPSIRRSQFWVPSSHHPLFETRHPFSGARQHSSWGPAKRDGLQRRIDRPEQRGSHSRKLG